jgi:hypothetical protein
MDQSRTWRGRASHLQKHPGSPAWSGNNLATETELCDFLENAERRAFKQAAFAVRDDHTSLDIAQEAMFKLVDRYRDRRAAAE